MDIKKKSNWWNFRSRWWWSSINLWNFNRMKMGLCTRIGVYLSVWILNVDKSAQTIEASSLFFALLMNGPVSRVFRNWIFCSIKIEKSIVTIYPFSSSRHTAPVYWTLSAQNKIIKMNHFIVDMWEALNHTNNKNTVFFSSNCMSRCSCVKQTITEIFAKSSWLSDIPFRQFLSGS